MGLDNGIVLRTNTKISVKHSDGFDVPDYVYLEELEPSPTDHGKFQYSYEVCYFRKSWAFRAMVFAVLDHRSNDDKGKDNGVTELNPREIVAIRDGLLDFLKNPEDWDDGAQAFYMEDSFAHIAQDALNLGWLVDWLDDHPHDLVYFYDSY